MFYWSSILMIQVVPMRLFFHHGLEISQYINLLIRAFGNVGGLVKATYLVSLFYIVLMEMIFHIPNSNTQFVGDESHHPSPQVFHDKIMSTDDVDAEEAVVTFDGISILTPRGLYRVELHIVMQFETDCVVESTFSINEDLLNTKLESSYEGLIHDVFTNILRALSSAKVTRPGKSRSCQDGYAVKSSLKAEDGILNQLEESFIFLPKPPALILHEENDYMEFQRHGVAASNMHYFDLLVKLKTDQEYLFGNIKRSEYQNLFDFISNKGLEIMSVGDAANQPTLSIGPLSSDGEDSHMKSISDAQDESNEEYMEKENPGIAFLDIGKVLLGGVEEDVS